MFGLTACSEKLPSEKGSYRTYSEVGGFETCYWNGGRWISPSQHADWITHWSSEVDQEPLKPRKTPNSLSVVVTGRNDNYDGNFDVRLITALSRNIEVLPDAEFIYVCWNPLPDKPPLAVKLKKLFPRLKCYVVHPKFHAQYCTIDGFLEYPAKNVGIRRARGEYILSTNSDVIISPQVAEGMRMCQLRWDEVYRATRVDIPFHNLNVTFPLAKESILQEQQGLYNASGDFLFLHKETWGRLTGYCEEFPGQRLHKDSFAVYLLTEVFKYAWKDLGPITHWRHPSSWSATYRRPAVGDVNWDFKKSGYSMNKESWGLTYTQEIVKDGVTWLI